MSTDVHDRSICKHAFPQVYLVPSSCSPACKFTRSKMFRGMHVCTAPTHMQLHAIQEEADDLLMRVFGNEDQVSQLEHAPDSMVNAHDSFIDRLIDHSGEPIEV